MPLLKIARMGHPILRSVARPVVDPTDAAVRQLIADMRTTLADAEGVGLAAPQVHAGLRVILYRVPGARSTDGTAVPETVLINPVVEPIGTDTEVGWEGCLSIPGLRGCVPRPARIRYTGLDAEGRQVEGEAGGFHARVIQHEVDHLDGILYLDRMPDLRLLSFEDQWRHLLATGPAAPPAG